VERRCGLAPDCRGGEFELAVSMMMGAAYGYFLDYCRRLFRVSAYQQAKA
jgi:hypothetical protein